MRDRMLIVGIGVFAFLAVAVDFASTVLSMFADGALMLAVMGGVYVLYCHAQDAEAQLQAELDAARFELATLKAEKQGRLTVPAAEYIPPDPASLQSLGRPSLWSR